MINRESTNHRRVLRFSFAALAAVFMAASLLRADEPYARSRDYDLQHSRIALRFDLEQKKVLGDVTHTLSILRDGATKVAFDSIGLTIESVTVNKSPAKFETDADKLVVPLPAAAKAGEKFDVAIRYEGKPTKGLYFILPDKDYSDRPKQIWTQGESEDTRYYLPTYDYPNDRLTTETILTVPGSWLTVSNGKLISVTDAGKGLKTWTWRESLPSSTYLITVVAGEFDEVKDSWRGMPVTYYAPKGRGDRLPLDQLGRASALICALELERQERNARGDTRLGDWPFEIGLWVGLAATPNRMGGPGDTGPGGKRDMHVFDVGADNKLSNQKLFTDFVIDGVKCGPDGARCDVDGNLWVSSNGGRDLGYSGVMVWTPEGKLIGRIRLPEVCGNLCFGGPKRNRLFMAASQSLYALYVNTQGAGPG